MEFEVTEKNPNPWTKANFISRLFFWWLTPLIRKGNRGNLQISDVYDCPDVDSSDRVGGMLQKEWEKELRKQSEGKKPSLVKATIRTFGLLFILNGLFTFVEECFIHIFQPILLGYLIQHFAKTRVLDNTDLYLYAGSVCMLAAMFVFTHHPYFFGAQRFGMRIRIACCSLLYKKSLRLSQAALGKTTIGQIVNLLSNDVNRFDMSVVQLPYLFVGPLQTVIVITVLWFHIDYACLGGITILFLYIPLQVLMGKLFSKFRRKTAVLTDERIRLMNEIISGMRVIKMYTWEYPFAKLVDLIRRKEVKKIRHTAVLRGINISLFYVSLRMILLLTFVVYVLAVKGDLTPEKVFVSMALFGNLMLSMTLFFPLAVSQGAESIISLKRIEEFLLLEEQQESSLRNVSNLRPKLSQCGIWMHKVVAVWNKENELTLNDITLDVHPGELLAVVGPVGGGKSSLLMSILGELPIESGEVKVRGKMAYASQEPWVFSGSVKQNVIFGSDFDEERYKTVLNVCALDKDIELFPHGDNTLVGERGVSLSGGQKARVNLARAMYFEADIFLLDDPLSAVDAAVSKHLFEKCINGYLKDKVRILCTHQIQFLKGATQILVIKEGRVLGLGTYQQLIESGVDFGSLMEDYEQQERKRLESTTSNTSTEEVVSDTLLPVPLFESSLSVNSSADDHIEDEIEGENLINTMPKVVEEMKSSGSVKFKVYKEYIVSGSGCFLQMVLVIFYLATQFSFNGSDVWLTIWTSDETRRYNIRDCWEGLNQTYLEQNNVWNKTYGILVNISYFRENIFNISDYCLTLTENLSHNPDDDVAKMYFDLYIYAGLVLGVFILSLVRTSLFFTLCMKASTILHNKMFRCILRAPIAFFDNNPVGSILNRCSRDMGIIDDVIPQTASDCTQIFFNLMGILIVVVVIQPYLLLPTVVLSILFVLVRRFYIPTARDIKRYEGIAKSPVFSHLSTSLYGLTTIRAFEVQRPFELTFDHHQDKHTGMWFIFIATTRWFGMVLDWLCVLYICSVTLAMVFMPSEEASKAGQAGLAIVFALQLSGSFQWGVGQSAELESQMTSVERVIEYSNLDSEADLESKPEKQLPPDWPKQGAISFDDVSLQYSLDDPPVLNNLSFDIYPEEKIGIVGRTGAGKSSMIAVLFRMTEPYGSIKIDGISTLELGLHDLRSKISIIPQDPVLFSGPVRRNLDPFSEHSDEELWQALEEVYLKGSIEDLPGGLDTELTEGGSNFSVGQRQLICLARAIIRRNTILVLDEATANVDPKTDNLIQQTIRERFKYCTVLTIAHRLHTIMDSDRVLVLDAGRIKEFDEPHVLLQNPDSYFSHLVQMTGTAMAQQLRDVARQAHMNQTRYSRGDAC